MRTLVNVSMCWIVDYDLTVEVEPWRGDKSRGCGNSMRGRMEDATLYFVLAKYASSMEAWKVRTKAAG